MERPDWLTCYDKDMPSVLREVIEDLKWPHHERPLRALLQWYELMARSSTQSMMPKIEVIPGIEGFALVNPTALDSVRLRAALERLRSGQAMYCPHFISDPIAGSEHKVRMKFIDHILDDGFSIQNAEALAIADEDRATGLDSVRPPVATFGHSPSTPPHDGPAPAGTPAVPD